MDCRRVSAIGPGKRGGKPCIRGLRITVYDVLEYLASGMSEAEIFLDPRIPGDTSQSAGTSRDTRAPRSSGRTRPRGCWHREARSA